MEVPETRYVRSGEIAIAYQVHGSGEHDLLFSGTTTGNIETVWALPEAVRLFERLGRFARVIRFDRRDSGISDPIKNDLTIEAHAADALAVMDAVSAERPALLGGEESARAVAVLAATSPERAGPLIALAATARGAAALNPSLVDVVVSSLTSLDWPGQILGFFSPSWAADAVRRERMIRFIQTSSTPRQAERLLRMSLTSDLTAVLPLVQAPTLVLHPRDCTNPPSEPVREFARLIPGATFREIPGPDSFIYALDVDLLADLIEEFVTGTAPAPVTNRVLATVLFTDLVDSTQRAAQAGDRAWADTLERHLAVTRIAIAAHGGETIKTTGDGVLATFTGPAQGVRCAQRIISDAGDLGLRLRTGLHTGEVERTSDDVAGLAVHLAARITSLAGTGEILVSRTVRDLVIGSELRFTDRGEHELKGVPDHWALYAAVA
ncbi:MAG TPA: adenylate/guanylate cyclase domain-containing protein [Solirubrobacteraceae bacterium]|nr:adenylate/guanylate cyclase domain-containing protein [Solirubrobacteraceae bacterium]